MDAQGKYPRKYGQVFLRDKNIAKLEARALGIEPGASVLEIGPGDGILTEALLESGFLVTAVEADHRFAELLPEKFPQYAMEGRLNVIKGDFLKYGPGKFDGIAGNIPYHISSQVIFHLDDFIFKSAVMMVQLEFGKRLIASPGTPEYSRLSVNAQIRYDIHLMRKVPRRLFSPPPEVDSLLVVLSPKPNIDRRNLIRADEILKLLFSQRRKKIGKLLPASPQKYHDKRCGELSPAELYDLAISAL